MNTQTEIWTSLFWIIILIETRAAVIRAECLALYKYQQELFLRVKRITETAELISWTPDDETRSSGLQIRSRHQRGNHRQTRWLNESSVYYTLLKGQTHHLMSHLSRYRFLLLLLTQSHMTRLFHRLERYWNYINMQSKVTIYFPGHGVSLEGNQIYVLLYTYSTH